MEQLGGRESYSVSMVIHSELYWYPDYDCGFESHHEVCVSANGGSEVSVVVQGQTVVSKTAR